MQPSLTNLPTDLKYYLLQTCSPNSAKDVLLLATLNREYHSVFKQYESTLLLNALYPVVGEDYIVPALLPASAPSKPKTLSLPELKSLAEKLQSNERAASTEVINTAFGIASDISWFCHFALYNSTTKSPGFCARPGYFWGPDLSDWLLPAYHLAIQQEFSSALYTPDGMKPTDRDFTNKLLGC